MRVDPPHNVARRTFTPRPMPRPARRRTAARRTPRLSPHEHASARILRWEREASHWDLAYARADRLGGLGDGAMLATAVLRRLSDEHGPWQASSWEPTPALAPVPGVGYATIPAPIAPALLLAELHRTDGRLGVWSSLSRCPDPQAVRAHARRLVARGRIESETHAITAALTAVWLRCVAWSWAHGDAAEAVLSGGDAGAVLLAEDRRVLDAVWFATGRGLTMEREQMLSAVIGRVHGWDATRVTGWFDGGRRDEAHERWRFYEALAARA